MSDLPPSLVIDDLGIEWNGGKYDAIELKEPKAIHIEKAMSSVNGTLTDQSVIKYQIALICAVSGLPRQVIEEMPISKLNEAFKYLQGFSQIG